MGIAGAAAPLVGLLLPPLPLSSTVEDDEESLEVPDPLVPLELDPDPDPVPVPVALAPVMVLVAMVMAVVASGP